LNTSKERIYNIPNFLSLYRLLSVPFLFYVVYLGQEQVFFYWFLFNMFTDGLDGFIARRFNMQTKLGAKLDSTADFAMYLLGMYALIRLKWDVLEPYKFSFFLLIFYYIFIDVFSLIKFKEISSLHLISSKASGVLEALFFFLLFYNGFSPLLYWLMFIVVSFSFVENMYFLFKIDKMKSDLKGFFWQKNDFSY